MTEKQVYPFLCINPILQDNSVPKYIYHINKESIELFSLLCSKRIYIKGFIEENFMGDKIYHKEVYGLNKLEEGKSLLIVANESERDKLKRYNVCYEPFVINPDINTKQVWIYGAGYIGQLVQDNLEERRIEIKGFIESDKKKIGSKINQKEIFGKEIIYDMPEEASIIEAGKYHKEIDEIICKVRKNANCFFVKDKLGLGIYKENKVIVDEEKEIFWKKASLMSLAETFEGKKYIFYGKDINLACKYCEIFEMLDFKDVLIVSDDGAKCTKYPMLNTVEDILYETNYLVLLYGEDDHYVDILLSLGLQEVKDFVHINQPSILYSINFRKQILDVNFGYTYKMNSEFPGIYVYGKNNKNDYKIAVLGGSTTDSTIAPFKSWVQILYEDYCEKIGEVTIFNGAIGGYNSTQELLKLIRDMICLKPDMIIVYDGYNDARDAVRGSANCFAFPYVMDIFNVINGKVKNCDSPVMRVDVEKVWAGISNEKDVVDGWLKNIEYMNAISQINGIKFISFLQPMLPSKKVLSAHEYSLMEMIKNTYSEAVIAAAQRFRERGKQIQDSFNFVYDLSDIFDYADVYMDICHVYESGNVIIAKNVFDVMRGKM